MKLSQTTDDDLKDAFGRFGTVIDAKIIMDRDTGRSRGFAFVSFSDTRDAEEALKKLNGEVRTPLSLTSLASRLLPS
jgi:heterogeneous nuclear ribonucleoprotein A1/A3